MKLGSIVIACLAQASTDADADRNVNPLQRLNRLVEFGDEILNSGSFNNKPARWITNWVRKIAVNGQRMEKAFLRGDQRCGYDSDSEQYVIKSFEDFEKI